MAATVDFLWSQQSGLLVLFVIILYFVSVAWYRLYFSPLAKFPGPKLAALTFWVEFYHDVLRRGQFGFEIVKMHERYGPIVRITPDEVHIRDREYSDEVYPGSHKQSEKHRSAAGAFGNSKSIISTIPHNHHRIRRSALSPFFSKRSVMEYSGSIQLCVEKLCTRLEEFCASQRPVNLYVALSALTIDVISLYCYGKAYDSLGKPDFDAELEKNMSSAGELALLLRQCPWIFTLANLLPYSIAIRLDPKVKGMINRRKGIGEQIHVIMSGDKIDLKHAGQPPSIFRELLDSDIPAEEKSVTRLVDEGITLLGAGSITSARAMSTIVYHVLANPKILQTVQKELREAIPIGSDISTQALLVQLEHLPYFEATITEGLRIANSIARRVVRVAPDRSLKFQNWVIPPGTAVSMTSDLMHTDPIIFPAPREFRPERWLQSDTGSTVPLKKYLMPFGKGSRICLGINLAYAELFLTLAALFRRFELELFETTRADVDVAHDFVAGTPRLDSKGVRVVVSKRLD